WQVTKRLLSRDKNSVWTVESHSDEIATSTNDYKPTPHESAPMTKLAIETTNTKSQTSVNALALRDTLNVYMDSTKRFPLLSREEEHALAIRLVEDGDTHAARRLVESNLRLVVKIAHEYRQAHQNLMDIVQEGNIGLMQAVSKYDPHRGVKLSSYAAWWIRAYILKFILNNHRIVKVGTTQAQRKLFFNLKKESDKLLAQGFSVDAGAIAKALDVRERDVVEMQKRLGANDASFDAPIGSGDDESTRTRHDVVEASDGQRPDQVVEASQFQALLKSKVDDFASTLRGRDERIFRGRWLSEEPMKLRELGEEFGVSRERTRQIEKKLLGRVKQYLQAELGTAVNIGTMAQAA
ncbi:MAG: RNA polymerase factor sigma-32, partial [Kofleriaceae bacterium]|nr:RNA polymerase factor sigma-32 [Kofleriaceae bacterium]